MIGDLAIFVGVVEAGSFSEAARRLGLPKSSVSFRVAQLERRLGTRLLERTTRVVRPTELGQIYFDRCTHILAEIQDAEELLQEGAIPRGILRLAAPIEFGMQILGPVVAEFKQRHPQLRIEVELTSRHLDLIEERFDLALRIGRLSDSSMISRRLLSIARCAYASPGYLARNAAPADPQALMGHDCLHFASPYVPRHWTFHRAGEEVSVTPSCHVVINNLTMLRDAAVAGLGIALLPRYLGDEAAGRGALRPVLEGWMPASADVFVVYPSRRFVPAKVREFIAYLEQSLPTAQPQIWPPSPPTEAR